MTLNWAGFAPSCASWIAMRNRAEAGLPTDVALPKSPRPASGRRGGRASATDSGGPSAPLRTSKPSHSTWALGGSGANIIRVAQNIRIAVRLAGSKRVARSKACGLFRGANRVVGSFSGYGVNRGLGSAQPTIQARQRTKGDYLRFIATMNGSRVRGDSNAMVSGASQTVSLHC